MTSKVAEMMKNNANNPYDYSWRELNTMDGKLIKYILI